MKPNMEKPYWWNIQNNVKKYWSYKQSEKVYAWKGFVHIMLYSSVAIHELRNTFLG